MGSIHSFFAFLLSVFWPGFWWDLQEKAEYLDQEECEEGEGWMMERDGMVEKDGRMEKDG